MKYVDIGSIAELHEFFHYAAPVHPQISIVDLAKVGRSHREPGVGYRINLYSVACKKIEGYFGYGHTSYDFSAGTLMFTSPNQVLTPSAENRVTGWGLYIHPDLLNASTRGHQLTEYSFFDYGAHEALHISDAEKGTLEHILQHVQQEISNNLDQHSYDLILTNLELLLSYSARFYGRQFLTRVKAGNDVVARFEALLNAYFAEESLLEAGMPDVGYFASRLNLSANYLADLLSKYTGRPTHEHIHLKLVDKAKSLLLGTDRSISEIAYELGFAHPSHFTKLFKNKAGRSPKEFRSSGTG